MNRIFQGIAHQTPFSRDMLIIDENRSVVILKPDRSEAVKNHSPDRFNWGYGESETAQLAPSILLEVTMVINEDVPLLLFSIFGYLYNAINENWIRRWEVCKSGGSKKLDTLCFHPSGKS